jgi:hypothetical protein
VIVESAADLLAMREAIRHWRGAASGCPPYDAMLPAIVDLHPEVRALSEPTAEQVSAALAVAMVGGVVPLSDRDGLIAHGLDCVTHDLRAQTISLSPRLVADFEARRVAPRTRRAAGAR